MTDQTALADRFEAHRTQLRAMAYRMLGSAGEADDAVQDAWLRLARTDPDGIDNLEAWLRTVVSRLCLDTLRARAARREDPLGPHQPAPAESTDPEHEAELVEQVGRAMLVVLDALGPAERVAFVLHDVFGVPFDDVAAILGKSPAASRQIASRARRRVSAAPVDAGSRRATAVAAFLAASRDGDFTGLVELLDPDAVFRTFTDDAPPALVHGAPAIAEAFMFRAKAALTVALDGRIGIAVPSPAGDGLLLVMDVSFAPSGSIASIDATLRHDELAVVQVRELPLSRSGTA